MAADKHFTYKGSGVDVAAGNEAVRLLKERLRSIHHPLVLEGIGGLGGLTLTLSICKWSCNRRAVIGSTGFMPGNNQPPSSIAP